MDKYHQQLIKDIHKIVRDQTIRNEYAFLIKMGWTSKSAKEKIAATPRFDTNKTRYFLSVSNIENIIYPLQEDLDERQ